MFTDFFYWWNRVTVTSKTSYCDKWYFDIWSFRAVTISLISLSVVWPKFSRAHFKWSVKLNNFRISHGELSPNLFPCVCVCLCGVLGVKVIFRVGLVLLKCMLGSQEKLKTCQGQYETMERLRKVEPRYMQEGFLIKEVQHTHAFMQYWKQLLCYLFKKRIWNL